jgi:hypothetical protein
MDPPGAAFAASTPSLGLCTVLYDALPMVVLLCWQPKATCAFCAPALCIALLCECDHSQVPAGPLPHRVDSRRSGKCRQMRAYLLCMSVLSGQAVWTWYQNRSVAWVFVLLSWLFELHAVWLDAVISSCLPGWHWQFLSPCRQQVSCKCRQLRAYLLCMSVLSGQAVWTWYQNRSMARVFVLLSWRVAFRCFVA